MTRDDLDFISPYLNQVNISEKERSFIVKGRKALKAAQRRIQLIVATVILVLLAAAGYSFLQKVEADSQRLEADEQRKIAELNEKKAEDAQEADSLKAIDLGIALVAAKLSKDTAEVARLEAEIERENAEAAALDALLSEAKTILSKDPKKALTILNRILEKNFQHKEALAISSSINKENFYTYKFEDGENSNILSMDVSNDARLIAAGYENARIVVWSLSEKKKILTIEEDDGPVYALKFINNNSFISSAGQQGTLKRWKIQNNSFSKEEEYKSGSRIFSLALMKSSVPVRITYILGGDEQGNVKRFEADNLKNAGILYSIGSPDQILSLDIKVNTFSDFGRKQTNSFAFGATNGGFYHLIEKNISEERPGQQDTIMNYHESIITASKTMVLEEESYYIFGDFNGMITLLNKKGEIYRKFKAHNGPVYALETKNSQLISGGGDAKIKIWDAFSLKKPLVLEGHYQPISALVLKNTKLYASSADGSLSIWKLPVKKE